MRLKEGAKRQWESISGESEARLEWEMDGIKQKQSENRTEKEMTGDWRRKREGAKEGGERRKDRKQHNRNHPKNQQREETEQAMHERNT